jgi:Flp pilus assembly protein TadD
MKFRYFPVPDREAPARDLRFLPSMALTVLSRMGEDSQNYLLQGVFCRRLPQVLKQKLDVLGHFRTGMAVPLKEGGKDYQEIATGQFWKDNAFLPPQEVYDYVLGGSLSLDQGRLNLALYSNLDDSILLDKTYEGVPGDFFRFVNEFTREVVEFLEVVAAREDLEKVWKKPVGNYQALVFLLEALDWDLSRGVFPEREERYLDGLRKSLEKDPESDDVAGLLVLDALSRLRRQDEAGAGAIGDFLLSLRPGDVQANFLKTRVLFQQGKTPEALDRLDSLARSGLEVQKVPYLIALELMETHNVEEALLFFQKAVELGCREPSLFENYAYLLIHAGEMEKALEILGEGQARFPGREGALTYTAQVLAELDRLDDAASTYRKALSLFPGSPRLLTSYAIYHVICGRRDEALKSLGEALATAPEDPELNLEAARIYEHLQDPAPASRFARTAMELDPGSRLAGEAHDLLSRVTGGISPEEQARNRELYIKAKRLFDLGHKTRCIEILDSITQGEPLFWKAWFLKGMAYRRQEKFRDALEAFQNVDELFPDQASLYHEVGRCLMGMERFKEALPYLLSAFQKRPQDPVIMANMGLIYLFTGKVIEAEVLLMQAQRMSAPGALNLEPYIEEARRLKKKKQAGRGNGESRDRKYENGE